MRKIPAISEDDFTAQVIEYAKLHGWRTAHFRPAKTAKGWRTAVQGDGKGFPDLVLVHEGKCLIIVAELKAASGKVSPEQREWLIAFELAEVPAYIWRPIDWPEIERVLA